MSDDMKQCASTPAATLEQHITDPNFPKNEAEWWAYREIERLRAELAAERTWRAMLETSERVKLEALEEAEAERDALRAELVSSNALVQELREVVRRYYVPIPGPLLARIDAALNKGGGHGDG